MDITTCTKNIYYCKLCVGLLSNCCALTKINFPSITNGKTAMVDACSSVDMRGMIPSLKH